MISLGAPVWEGSTNTYLPQVSADSVAGIITGVTAGVVTRVIAGVTKGVATVFREI